MQMMAARFASPLLLMACVSVALAGPAVTTHPHKGPPDEKITVSGTGFGASEVVEIYFDTTALVLARTTADGEFSRPLHIPKSAVPGEHTISAVGRRNGSSAQGAFLVQTDWREFQHGPDHQGYNPKENVLSPANAGELRLLWSVNSPASSAPVVVDGKVYAGSVGEMHAFDAATGSPIWSASLAGGAGTASVANGVLYVASGFPNSNLFAFNAATGEPIWSIVTDDETVTTWPTVENGMAYVGYDDLYAVDAMTGRLVWKAGTPDLRPVDSSSPAVANGVVYIGSLDGSLYAFNATTGTPLWRAATNGQILASPTVADGMVYVGSFDGKLYAFDAATGQIVWSSAAGVVHYSAAAVANGMVYVGSDDGMLYAFGAASGGLLWSAAMGDSIESSPAIANGVVYAGSIGGRVAAFNAATGSQLWSAAAGSSYTSSFAIANGMVYVVSQSNGLCAFGLAPGSEAARAAEPPARPDPAALKPDLTLRIEDR